MVVQNYLQKYIAHLQIPPPLFHSFHNTLFISHIHFYLHFQVKVAPFGLGEGGTTEKKHPPYLHFGAQKGLKLQNTIMGLSIEAMVASIYASTFYSVSQEHFLDELELEAKVPSGTSSKESTRLMIVEYAIKMGH
uniref:Cytochrome c oxidase assembly factor 3 mitochondrial coiled-coil domain-containing protein n=1 Tax=Salvator merianae TaxID=96440 RepID=A0A8D0AYU5_SALMN